MVIAPETEICVVGLITALINALQVFVRPRPHPQPCLQVCILPLADTAQKHVDFNYCHNTWDQLRRRIKYGVISRGHVCMQHGAGFLPWLAAVPVSAFCYPVVMLGVQT